MKVNELGLVRVKITRPGVEMHMVGQVAGFAPHIAENLINRNYAIEYTDKMLREEEQKAAELAEGGGDYRFSRTSPLKNPGFGAPGTQTGHNVADLEQAGMVLSPAGPVNADASVSIRSVGDMTNAPNVPVTEGGSLGGRAASQQGGDVTTIKGADGEQVEIPARWEDQHHTKIMALGRRLSGKDDLNTEEAKAVITKALEDQRSNGEE